MICKKTVSFEDPRILLSCKNPLFGKGRKSEFWVFVACPYHHNRVYLEIGPPDGSKLCISLRKIWWLPRGWRIRNPIFRQVNRSKLVGYMPLRSSKYNIVLHEKNKKSYITLSPMYFSLPPKWLELYSQLQTNYQFVWIMTSEVQLVRPPHLCLLSKIQNPSLYPSV